MNYRQITAGCVACLMAGMANADDMASISLANGTDHVFTSLTIIGIRACKYSKYLVTREISWFG